MERIWMMKRTFRLLSVPLALVLLLASLGPSLALDRKTRLDVMSGVVQISLVKVKGGEVYYLTWGSGTIISPDGLILTNCHVADPIRYGLPAESVPDFDYLGIGLTIRSDRPPQLAYLGEVVQADPYLDLAVIRITHKIDLNPVSGDDLNLPSVELGSSADLVVGDDLNIFGYPGIGGETVTFTRGVVSGFSLDAAITGSAWIKTDASISGGNSGGTAVDEQGKLVGVPTRAGVGGGTDPVDCRPVKDTNGDGRVDGNDDCVPVGGFINALRPIDLSRPLIEAAIRGLSDTGQPDPPSDPDRPTGTPRFSNYFFSSGVNDLNQPTAVVSSLPSGTRSLYLFFDYENMDKSKTLEMKVFIDGQEATEWGLPAGPWGGSQQGLWWIGWADAEFPDGNYKLVPYVDGKRMGEAQIEIGGRETSEPRFENLTLSLKMTADEEPQEATVLLPAGATEFYAFFDYENMSDGDDWTRTWYVDGKQALTKTDAWDGGKSGNYWFSTTSSSGISPGAYRIELSVEDELAAVTSFWVTGDEGSGAAFDPITFAEGIDQEGNPVAAAQSFTAGLDELHAFSGYTGMEDGMDFTVNWFIDGNKVIESPEQWKGGESGSWHYYIWSDSGSLPDGEYGLELAVSGQVLQSAKTTVGTGTPPPPDPPDKPEDGVQIQGIISDLDSGRPIPGALFLVLEPGITLDTFQWTDDEIYALGEADRQGYYKLNALVERGQCYSMIVGANGYWPYGEDDVCIAENSESLLELPARLEKK
jgi:S1-C subfamily serine protease